ncbi:PAS/PAC sensor signal transduction histidine kinase [Dehalococcoides mccartyi GY50]|nr:PAS/PAC sensor signal transduction histidine kinase [Dehalococcoides mccartyi GY50]
MFENTGTAMAIQREDHLIMFVNETFVKSFGYSKSEIEGKMRWDDLVASKNKKAILKKYTKFMNSDRLAPHMEEVWVSNRKGQDFILRGILNQIPDTQYQVVSFLDITSLKKTEYELRESKYQLRQLSNHLMQARELERKRIALEIHDHFGQALAGLNADLNWLNQEIKIPGGKCKNKINEMTDLVGVIIQDIKRLATDLRPPILDTLGLVPAIEWLSETFEQRTGIKCYLDISPSEFNLNPEQTINIFRIFQEALTNISRHSCADEVKINICQTTRKILIGIADNGIGITPKIANSEESFGIISIKERVLALNGFVKISGETGVGTKIIIEIPRSEGD